MRIDAAYLTPAHILPLKHIVIIGNDDQQRELVLTQLKQTLAQNQLSLTSQYHIDETGFNWHDVESQANNFSLFDDEQTILFLRSQQPLKKEQHDKLNQLISANSGSFFIIALNKFTKAQEKQPWFKTILDCALVIEAKSVPNYKLPNIVKAKLNQSQLTATTIGYEMLANHFQGNYLGLMQELSKLPLIFKPGFISEQQISDCLSQQSAYTPFECIDCAIANQPAKAAAIFEQLQKNKMQPAIILWSIINELRALINLKFDIDKGISLQQALNTHNVWQSKKSAYTKQLQANPLNHFYQLLTQAKEVDLAIKGLSPIDAWSALRALIINL